MKANELMVGDWVKIKTYGVSDKFERTEAYIYVKIAEIGSGLITIYFNNDIKEPYRIIKNTEIEPIPLTPEILEKNGFTYIIVLEEVAPKLENFELDNHWEGDGYSWNGIPLLYVHQLQHALRICGIEKEIIL